MVRVSSGNPTGATAQKTGNGRNWAKWLKERNSPKKCSEKEREECIQGLNETQLSFTHLSHSYIKESMTVYGESMPSPPYLLKWLQPLFSLPGSNMGSKLGTDKSG